MILKVLEQFLFAWIELYRRWLKVVALSERPYIFRAIAYLYMRGTTQHEYKAKYIFLSPIKQAYIYQSCYVIYVGF